MFRGQDLQQSQWLSEFLITLKKAQRMERTWAEVFRREALPQIEEEQFAGAEGAVGCPLGHPADTA